MHENNSLGGLGKDVDNGLDLEAGFIRILSWLLLVVPLLQSNLTTQLPPLRKPPTLHLSRNLSQLVKIPVTLPDEFPFSSPLLDNLIGGKVALRDDLTVYRDFRTGVLVQKGVHEPPENR